MSKRVLAEGTAQRVDDGGKLMWRAVRNGFGRCADELKVVCDVTSRYRGRTF